MHTECIWLVTEDIGNHRFVLVERILHLLDKVVLFGDDVLALERGQLGLHVAEHPLTSFAIALTRLRASAAERTVRMRPASGVRTSSREVATRWSNLRCEGREEVKEC